MEKSLNIVYLSATTASSTTAWKVRRANLLGQVFNHVLFQKLSNCILWIIFRKLQFH